MIILWSSYDHHIWSYVNHHITMVVRIDAIIHLLRCTLSHHSHDWHACLFLMRRLLMRWECFWSRWWRWHGENVLIGKYHSNDWHALLMRMLLKQISTRTRWEWTLRLAKFVSIIQTGEMIRFVLITSMKQHLTLSPDIDLISSSKWHGWHKYTLGSKSRSSWNG